MLSQDFSVRDVATVQMRGTFCAAWRQPGEMEDFAELIAHPGGRKTGAAPVATSLEKRPDNM
jgi:hypothetical protein